MLCAEGFTVLPYVNADPVLCKRLEEVGCATVMPLGSWIGSNQGLRTKAALEIIVEQSLVPVVVDAGIGAPSQAAEAMEIGADAVLVNTAIGTAGDPVAMGAAFRLAVEAGRAGFLAGLRGRGRRPRSASSPLTGFLSMPSIDVEPVRAGVTSRRRAAGHAPPPTWSPTDIAGLRALVDTRHRGRRRPGPAARRGRRRPTSPRCSRPPPPIASRTWRAAAHDDDRAPVRPHRAPVRAALPVERVRVGVHLLRVLRRATRSPAAR